MITIHYSVFTFIRDGWSVYCIMCSLESFVIVDDTCFCVRHTCGSLGKAIVDALWEDNVTEVFWTVSVIVLSNILCSFTTGAIKLELWLWIMEKRLQWIKWTQAQQADTLFNQNNLKCVQETRIVTYIHLFVHKWNLCVLCRKSRSNWPRVLTRHSPPQTRDHGSSYQAVQASISFQLKSDKTNGECFLTLPIPHYITEDPQDNGTNVINCIHIVYYIHTLE